MCDDWIDEGLEAEDWGDYWNDKGEIGEREIVREFPGVLAVHHINGDPTDNRLDNLTFVSVRENRKRS